MADDVAITPCPDEELRNQVHELLGEQDPRPWRRTVEQDSCQLCRGFNPVWWVQNELWNGVMTHHRGATLCPSCFIKAAEASGIGQTGTWQLYPPAAL